MIKKGLEELYDVAALCITNNTHRFYEWRMDSEKTLKIGQLCESLVWYEEKERWYLVEDEFDAKDESLTTWLAKPVRGSSLPTPRLRVMKHFNLEKEEFLMAVNSKVRPVVLLQKYDNTWWSLPNEKTGRSYWLCLPIFSYKEDRHTQRFVLNDQALKAASRFYLPSFYSKYPGLRMEGCARLDALQMIAESALKPLKLHCTISDPIMERRFCISEFGLTMLIKHLFNSIKIFQEPKIAEGNYNFFAEYCSELVEEALSQLNTKPQTP